MNNSGWIDINDEPLPDGVTVLVLFEEPEPGHGSRVGIYTSRKMNNNYIGIVNGRFLFDWNIPIVAWHRLDELTSSIPLKYTDK